MGQVIAVDLGGTQVRAAAYPSESETPVKHRRIGTHAPNEEVFTRIVGLVQSVWPEEDEVRAIGLSSPGPLDPHQGIILDTPNIPEWHDFPLGANLTEYFHVPVYLDND